MGVSIDSIIRTPDAAGRCSAQAALAAGCGRESLPAVAMHACDAELR
jgi:hypothetical protein